MGKKELATATQHASRHLPASKNWELIQAEGAGPFITRIVHRLPDGSLHTWIARTHRKCGGIRRGLTVNRWAPSELGWWISILFMIGSSCFALGSIIGVLPQAFDAILQQPTVVNSIFFTGSLFFTSAAYCQLLEAANADRRAAQARGEIPNEAFCWMGWKPTHIGWLSGFIQFIGTLLFNMNTLDALWPGLNWFQQDVLIWVPDVIGSICFLVSSWLAVLECCHGIAIWKIQGISWWIVMINLLGSISFGISAVFAVILPQASDVLGPYAANLWTFIGAICFLVAARCLLPEMAQNASTST
ncbi:hypothetical protein P3T73_10220 [Kiritimatiellota bacterium B12222]|nr:hypothetical protein P3T73_10220 [Kiritimatiellota bacterium B12222]